MQPFWRTAGRAPTLSSSELGTRPGQWLVDHWGSPQPFASLAGVASLKACISHCQPTPPAATASCEAVIFGAERSCSGAILPKMSLGAPNYKRVPYFKDAAACAAACRNDTGSCGSAVFRPGGSLPGQDCGGGSRAAESCCYLIHEPSPAVEPSRDGMWDSYVSMADTPPPAPSWPSADGSALANMTDTAAAAAVTGGCCYLINQSGVAASSRLRHTVSAGWSMWGRGAFTVATQQQLFRDPAVVIKYFTSVEAVGKGRDTVWKLKLDTGFGQTYSFEMSSTGVITHIYVEYNGSA